MKKSILIVSFFGLLIIKTCTVYWSSKSVDCLTNEKNKVGYIAQRAGDTEAYIGSMENYIQHGEYYFFNGEEKIYASRLPHYSIPYFFLRFFFSKSISSDLIILFQILIECIAIIYLALLSKRLFNHERYFFIVIGVLAISLYWTHWTGILLTESLSISLFCILLFIYDSYKRSNKVKDLVIMGILLGILATLKPYLVPLFLIPGLYFIKQHGLKSFSSIGHIFKKTVIVSLPLILFITPWIWRNYNVYNQFVPTQINMTAGYRYSDAHFAMRDYLASWGGIIAYWDHRSAGCYFDAREGYPCSYELPKYLETDNYKFEDIRRIRDLYIKAQHVDTSLQKQAIDQLNLLTQDFKEQKPFYSAVVAPSKLTLKAYLHSGSYYLPVQLGSECASWWHLPLKGIQSLLYWFMIIFGTIGLFSLIKDRKGIEMGIFTIGYLLLLFCFIMRSIEWRVFHIFYPIYLIGTVYFSSKRIDWIIQKLPSWTKTKMLH